MKYILLILLLVSTVASFGQTKLIAKLTRNSSTDTTYGLLNDSLIIGGHMTLSSIANRDAIPFSNRTRGMFAVVNDTVFILKGGISNANWQIFTVDISQLVPKSRTISINGVTKSLDSNITFTTRSANGTITYAGVYLTKPNDSTVAADTTALGTLFRLKRDKINADSLNGQLPSYYLNRTNQTGTQPISTITGLSGNAPISYSSGAISADTGRGTAQLTTGYDLKKVRDSVQANIPTNYLTTNTTETVTAEKTFNKNKLAIYNPALGTQVFLNATDDATASTVKFPNSSNDTVAYRSWVKQNGGGGGGSGSGKVYSGYGLSNTNDSTLKADTLKIATVKSLKDSLSKYQLLLDGIIHIDSVKKTGALQVTAYATSPSPTTWRITASTGQHTYVSTSNTILTINAAATNYYRKDIIIADTLNNLSVIQGVADTAIANSPSLPQYSVLITTIDVSGNTIGTVPTPDLSQFVTKTGNSIITGTFDYRNTLTIKTKVNTGNGFDANGIRLSSVNEYGLGSNTQFQQAISPVINAYSDAGYFSTDVMDMVLSYKNLGGKTSPSRFIITNQTGGAIDFWLAPTAKLRWNNRTIATLNDLTDSGYTKSQIDSINVLNLKKIDTSVMLSNYRTAIQKNTDSVAAHNLRIGGNTTNIASNTSAIALKLNISDTVAMLSNYRSAIITNTTISRGDYYRINQLDDSTVVILSYDSTRRDTLAFSSGTGSGGGGSTIDTTSLSNRINTKQPTLVSGSNIKTINGSSLLGGGDLVVSGSGVSSITGTANQVIASASTGAVTLSLPQSIATTSKPTFSKVTADSLVKTGSASTDALMGNGSTQVIKSGRYSPTASSLAGCSSVTASTAQYMQVGNTVTVSGEISLTPSSVGGNFYFNLSLPVSANFSSATGKACGVATRSNGNTTSPCIGSISGDSVGGNAVIFLFSAAPATTADYYYYTYTYTIL